MRSTGRWFGVTVGVVVVLMSSTASAQVIGTFRWQLAPYCNVVTLRVEQKGTLYELAGTDNQCGAGQLAAANGSAHLNPDGTVGLALTVSRPDGLTLATSATLSLVTFSGTWSDDHANTGMFVFEPASPAPGEPRRITLVGTYALSYQAAGTNDRGSASISFGRLLPSAPEWAGNIIQELQAPTANCPGSYATPRALPGQLCVYEGFTYNVATRAILNSDSGAAGDRFGASLFILAAAPGPTSVTGRWAVTIP